MPALLGGLFLGVLSALPIVQLCNCCCIWIAGGGMLAAYLQQQNQPRPITRLEGARVGLVAGGIGAVVWFAVDTALAPLQARLVGEVLRNTRDLPPEVQTLLEAVEAGQGSSNALGFFLFLVFGSAVSALGGMIGAAYFRNDVPPALGGPIHPPALP